MYVVKRDKSRSPLDISKIQKYTSEAVKGLTGVSQSELEVDAKLQFRDNMLTSEIQSTLIKAAVDKIDVDTPNWTFVAARLFIYDLYHRVSGFTGYTHLKEYFKIGEKEGRLIAGLKDKFDLEYLNGKIRPERDLQFNYLGIKTLSDRYLIKDKKGDAIELPQHMFMGVAMFLAQAEDEPNEWAVKFYNMMSKFEVMMATPTLSNARTNRHQLSSCYIGSTPDNIEGIFDSYKEMSLLSKFGGGIGWDWTNVRSAGSFIDNHKNAASGVVPFLKVTNDIALAVDQLGTRKGAIAAYLEPWHMDVNDFLDLKKNSGEERLRAHDIFPALWINDIFMKRVEEDREWSLFDPYETKDLTKLYGSSFEEKYLEYENDLSIRKEVIRAKDLWKKILTSYFETGSPFLCFKDTANKVNPNDHYGVIHSSNLCTEIFQNTKPDTNKVKVIYHNGKVDLFDEDEIVKTDNGVEKVSSKLTSLDSINGKKVYVIEKEKVDGSTAVCNLASINLSVINTKEDIERIVPVAVRALDNVIDLNFYPYKKVRDTNMMSRSIGLGVMGEAEMLATKHIVWGSQEHFNTIDTIMEMVSFNTIKSSAMLSVEKGPYQMFEGSKWSRGIMPFDHTPSEVSSLVKRDLLDDKPDWDSLRALVKEKGVRNGYMMAIAPTSSISILTGTTQTIEPIYKRKWYEENLSGLIPVCVPKLDASTWEYYTSSYDIDQSLLIKAASIRQKWIDQGQSLNIFMKLNKATGKVLNDLYITAWKLGVKSTYYLRSQSPEPDHDSYVVDRGIECYSCQ